jgi:prolyl oligopeptidase
MRSMLPRVLAPLGFLVCVGLAAAQVAYPDAPRGDVTDDYFGVKVTDPYRWLEELDAAPTRAWIEAENKITFAYLEQIPQREPIKRRLTELWNYERFGIPFKEGGKYFYTYNAGLQNQNILFVADSLDATPRVLLDPNTFSADGTVSLASYTISPDGRYVAYATSDGGTDWKDWRIRDIASGKDTTDRLTFTKFTSMSWSRDSAGVFYSRHPVGADGKGDGRARVSVYYHAIGAPQSDDRLVYELPEEPTRNPYAAATEDGRFLVIGVYEGNIANAVHYLDLRDPGAKVVRLLDRWDALYEFLGNEGAVFYFQTTNGAPKGRVVAVDTADPAPEKWRTVVPEAEETLDGASLIGRRLVAQYLKDAKSLVKVYTLDGKPVGQVELPGIGSAGGFAGHETDPETFYSFSGFTTPTESYRYNVVTGETTLFRRPAVPGLDPAAYETRQVFYAGKDGTRIPMFIIHKKGITLDGSNPMLLYGYGGFNISLTPGYSTSRMVWMEMGGVLAIPNIRGGGEYGKAWHEAGTKLSKQNVFDDFIAAAQWLIDNKYTSTPKLAIQGGSNGGLLVGACMTQRPDLFGACLPAVGVLDMLRYHLPSMNARDWSTDYGLSENEPEFKAQLAYSPYHNVRKGTCYPPTLVTTADHDDRVVPWHSFKFAAALQWAQSCPNPVLIRVETRAGHGAGKPTWMTIEEIADQWAFLVRTLHMNPTLPEQAPVTTGN